MRRYLLDTNICIYTIKNRPAYVRQKLKEYDVGQILLSSITVSALYFGAYKSTQVERNLLALEHFLQPFGIAEYDTRAAATYGKIRADLQRRGQLIGSLDMLIAAHALSLDAVLVSNNLREFERVDGLPIENWAGRSGAI